MITCFGIISSESFNTVERLTAYDRGFKSVGVAATAKYEIFTGYFINADTRYDRLVGEAEKSPTIQNGDKNQYYSGLTSCTGSRSTCCECGRLRLRPRTFPGRDGLKREAAFNWRAIS